MDFYAELTKRRDAHFAAIGELGYKSFQLSVDGEAISKQMVEVAEQIHTKERIVGEIEQFLRDFDTYLAVKEGAMTMEGLHEIIDQGGDGSTEKGEEGGCDR